MSQRTYASALRRSGTEPRPEQTISGVAAGAYFWVMGFFVTFYWYIGCVGAQALVKLGLLPNDGRPVHRISSAWGRSLIALTPGWSVSVEGRENLLPDGQPSVIVANHESICDIFAMYHLRTQFRWLSKAEVFRLLFVGHAMTWSQYVPVHRGQHESQRRAMEESAKRLQLGLSMLFFPEGTRSTDGRIKEFKSGAFRLARDQRAPVVPVAIHGASAMLAKGSWIPRRAQVRMTVLPAVPPPAPDEDLDAYIAGVRERIVAAHAALV